MFKSVVKVCGSTVKLQLILDILSAVEAGGIRGVAVPLPAYSPGGILNAFAWPLAVYRKQRVFIVYRVDYQGI